MVDHCAHMFTYRRHHLALERKRLDQGWAKHKRATDQAWGMVLFFGAAWALAMPVAMLIGAILGKG